MKTFRFRNRFKREVDVPEELAVTLMGNPSMKFIGEVKVIIETKNIKVPVKGGRSKVSPRQVAVEQEVVKDSYPKSSTNDVSRDGKVIKLKTVIGRGGTNERPKSTLKKI